MQTELVGREPELAILTECLSAALDGRPQVVVCQGEPGIGKTRLATELVTSATAMGVLSAWGVAADSSSAPPYWPWWQVLRAIANTLDLPSMSRTRRLDAELARLAPDVFSSEEAQGQDGSAEDRFRQFDAVSRLLTEICRQTPLVIVFDDAHWADKPSLLLLQHVARVLTDEPLLLVVNFRTTEPSGGQLLAGLLREPVTTAVDLRGLDPPAIRRKLESVLVGDVDETEVAEVHRLTGGNPFFVGEVARAMADARAGRQFAPITATVREAIGERLDRLSPDCVRFLQAAALVGREFAVPIVASMAEVPTVRGLHLLDEAERAGLTEAGTAPHEHRFVHALVRDATAARVAPPEQVRFHRLAADAIEHHYAHRLGPHLFDVARHWAEAAIDGDEVTAANWIERAGDEAMRQLAYEEGARLFRQALHVGGRHLDAERRCRLSLAAGRASHLSGDPAGRLDACLEAAETARKIDRPDLLAEAALVMEPVGFPGFDVATRRLCEEALAALDPGLSAIRARVTARLVETFIFREFGAVASASAEALDLAERSGDLRALTAALRARQLVCSGPDGLDERMRVAERMLALGREAHDPQTELGARLCQIDASFEAGDFARVAAEIDALVVCAHQVRGPMARFEVARCRAALAQAQGRFADALRLELEAFTILAPTGLDVRFTLRGGLMAVIGHHIGQGAPSLAANRFEGAPEGHGEAIGLIASIAGAFTLVSAGHLDEAAAIYRSLGPVGGWRPPPHVILFSYAFGIAIAVALGAAADVAALHGLLAPHRRHHVVSGTSTIAYFGPVELWLGKASSHLGRLDDAVADLKQAEQVCAASGAAGFRVEAQYELAAALARRAGPGDFAQARSLLADGETTAATLGMAPLIAEIGALRQQVAERPDGFALTRREREVVELVGQGLTNRAIAERLFLSERTAENHVQHALTKLGLSNRSQLAVWVTNK